MLLNKICNTMKVFGYVHQELGGSMKAANNKMSVIGHFFLISMLGSPGVDNDE